MTLEQALHTKCPVCGEPLDWEFDPHFPPSWQSWCCENEYWIFIESVSVGGTDKDGQPTESPQPRTTEFGTPDR